MSNEIEAKFKVADFAAVRRALRAAGAKFMGNVEQTDDYYDTPDKSLLARDCGLRIRSTRIRRKGEATIDTRPLLTYKGPGGNHKRMKIRREVQTHLDCPIAIAEVLGACGMELTMTIQKRRTSYKLGRCMVELDELPVIGRFVEIEAPGEKFIDAACRKLRISVEPITDHYITLLCKACKRIAAGKRRNITFK